MLGNKNTLHNPAAVTRSSVPQRVISGTSLAAVAATGATAGAVYWSSDCVDTSSAAILAATAILTAPFGAKMTHRVDCQVRQCWLCGGRNAAGGSLALPLAVQVRQL